MLAFTISIFYLFDLFPFTLPFTPDSEFYWSLGSFGNELVSRTPWPAYYWTKTVLIAPQYYLSSIISPIETFKLIQLIQVLVIYYSLGRIIKPESKSLFNRYLLFFLIVFNSIIFWFRGNTYATGLAQTLIVLYITLLFNLINDSARYRNVIVGSLGFLLGTFLFLNPIICSVMGLISVIIYFVINGKVNYPLNKCITMILIYLFSICFSIGFWLCISESIFPGLKWFQTTIFYARNIKSSDFSSDQGIQILFTDPSIALIAIFSLVCLLIINLPKFKGTFLRFISIFHFLFFAFFLIDNLILNGSLLESSYYSALMWPTIALIYGCLILELLKSPDLRGRFSLQKFVILFIIAIYIIIGTLSVPKISQVFLMILGLIFLILLVISINQLRVPSNSKHANIYQMVLSLLILMTVQIFQNADSNFESLVTRHDYRIEFANESNRRLLERYIEIEHWVITNSGKDQKLLVWVEPGQDLVGYASMHLWGPNSISSGSFISAGEIASLSTSSPAGFISYFRNAKSFELFVESLPSSINAETSLCKEEKGSDINTGFKVCLTFFKSDGS